MNTLPTYQQQFDKITEAYIKGEIQPYDAEFCFCGTLAGGQDWLKSPYTGQELRDMEKGLLATIRKETIGFKGDIVYTYCTTYKAEGAYYEPLQTGEKDGHINPFLTRHPNYENALFNGMVAALEVLKQIHIERGEIIDQSPVFEKRVLTS